MFTAISDQPLPFEAPWTTTFAHRFAQFRSAERRVAYYFEEPNTTSFRYRGLNMVEALLAAPQHGVSAGFFSGAEQARMGVVLDQADLLVIGRTRYSAQVADLIAAARARNLPVVFDVDDLVFDPSLTRIVMESVVVDASRPENLDFWFALTARTGEVLRMCDRAIATNDYLAGRMHDYAPHLTRAHTIPNFLNREQEEISRGYYAAKRASGFARDGRINIGYFSGSPSHGRDFAVAQEALVRMLRRHEDVCLSVVGFAHCEHGLLEEFGDRLKILPLTNYLDLQRVIAQVEINIAPLMESVFTNCKSELKFFEAAIVGTITVASPTFTFANAMRDGDTGFLARGHEWEAKLEQAIALVRDGAAYAAMAERAFEAAQFYRWDGQAEGILSALFPGEASAHA